VKNERASNFQCELIQELRFSSEELPSG